MEWLWPEYKHNTVEMQSIPHMYSSSDVWINGQSDSNIWKSTSIIGYESSYKKYMIKSRVPLHGDLANLTGLSTSLVLDPKT